MKSSTGKHKKIDAGAATKGSISSTFWVPKQNSFCTDNFRCFQWQQHLAKMSQNMVLGAKTIA
jgi:hypothetical protein